MAKGTYTDRELMVIAAGREIRDGDLVFVGMRLPLVAFAFATRTHAPGALGIFDNGLVREEPAAETLMTMSDTPNIPGALWCAGTLDVMGLLQQGLIDLGFIGGAEIDRYGNLNTSYIGDRRHPTVRLPGSGGGADIASLAKRFVVIMPQERHRFVERAHFITSPGFGDGAGWRERVVAWRHVLRNALLPVTSIVGLQVGSMFAGAVLVEYIFSWPGINALLLNSLGTRDYPVIQGVVLLGSTLFVAVNLVTDLCYGLVNPRIRHG